MRELHETAKQQLIDDKPVDLVQRCFNSSLVTHFLIRIYQGGIEAYFMKGFACDTTHPAPNSKKSSFLKGAARKKIPTEKSLHRRRPTLPNND